MFHIDVSFLIIIILIIAFAVIAYVNLVRRKTNKKLSELNEIIRESEGKYKLVVENSPDIMFIQKGGQILFANKKFIELSGFSLEELKKISIFDLVSPEERENAIKFAKRRLEGGEVPDEYEIKTINKNGKVIYFDLHMSKTLYHGSEALLGIGADITVRKNRLEIIRRLSTAIDQSTASVVILDLNGIIEYANKAFCLLSGYEVEDVIGMNIRKLNPDNYPIEKSDAFWAHIKSGKQWEGEFQSKRKDGTYYWDSAVVSPITNSNGEITHFSTVSRNVTKEKEVFEKLKENEAKLQEANATKDRFFSIVAHDLKNPFNVIMGYSSLLYSQYEALSKAERLEYIQNINLASESTFDLLENILEWSRTQMGKIEFKPMGFDISNQINEVVLLAHAQADAKGIRLRTKTQQHTMVYADSYMTKTILRNLVSNAIKFTEKGEVAVETDIIDDKVMVSVIDTGVGIPDDVYHKLFRIDQQVKTTGTHNEKGTGLGLILSKEFVGKNGGEIWINRMEGQGTIFNFTLPSFK